MQSKIYKATSVGMLLDANEISTLIESIDVVVEFARKRDLSFDEKTLTKLRQRLSDMEKVVHQG